jgi:alpha-glucuronidase
MLFFHHLPYNHPLSNGKSVIQSIYDSHYEGAAKAAEFVQDWESLKGRIDPKLYADVLPRLEYQAGHAIVWRDAVTQYFHKLSGLPDEEDRVGNYPGRLEAEAARLTGYKVIDIRPWEDASQGKAVICDAASACAAEWTFTGKPGPYDIAVQYFDLRDGVARFTFRVNGQSIAAWSADASLPSIIPNGDNSTRRTIQSVALKPGDILRVEGTPDGQDRAALDYIELTPGAPPPAGPSEPPTVIRSLP